VITAAAPTAVAAAIMVTRFNRLFRRIAAVNNGTPS
jgi:hypothetical protein